MATAPQNSIRFGRRRDLVKKNRDQIKRGDFAGRPEDWKKWTGMYRQYMRVRLFQSTPYPSKSARLKRNRRPPLF